MKRVLKIGKNKIFKFKQLLENEKTQCFKK